MDDACPYISLVVTARNDDHGGNLLRRMQIFVNGWIAQSRRHNLSSELIIVEWNPPPDRPRLREVLRWPERFGPCSVRFIEVPAELHRRYKHADALPLYQMIAKNAGIRRALGKFILATNIDILFSDELASFLAEQRLDEASMYRVDRYDAMSEVPLDAGVEEQLEYCRTHLLRINPRGKTLSVTPDGRPQPEPLMARVAIWWRERVIGGLARGGPAVPGSIQRIAASYLQWGGLTGWLLTAVRILLGRHPIPKDELLHTNGCGDFTLAARRHWFDLRGYPEFDLFSMNIDSVFCYAAHYGGAREKVLQDPMRIYHIEHATGSGWTPEGQAQLFKRIAAKGLGILSYRDVISWAEQMRRLNCTTIFNHEDWGLANFDLVETEPTPAPTAARASADRV